MLSDRTNFLLEISWNEFEVGVKYFIVEERNRPSTVFN
jgi:hypothetical protein